MRMQATIQKWGNSLALRLTGPIKAIPHFEADMLVDIDIEESGITIYPAKKKLKKLPYTEKELLKGLNARTAHADLLAEPSDKEMGE